MAKLFDEGTASGEIAAGLIRGLGGSIGSYGDRMANKAAASRQAEQDAMQSQMDRLKLQKMQQELQPKQLPPEVLPTLEGLDASGRAELAQVAVDEELGYLADLRKQPLDQEGQQHAIRLQRILQQANSPEMRPSARAELLGEYEREKQRLRPEDHVQKIPTIEDELQTRMTVAPNGMQSIMQPDGRVDTKDPTTKVELEKLKQKEAQEQVRQQRVEQQRVKVEQQKQERQQRYQEFRAGLQKERPISERLDEARKEMESRYKTLNPNRPMRSFSPSEVNAYLEAKINRDFTEQERYSVLSQNKSKLDRFLELSNEDPAEAEEQFEDIRKKIQERDGLLAEEVTDEVVFAELEKPSPAERYQQYVQQRAMQEQEAFLQSALNAVPPTGPMDPNTPAGQFVGNLFGPTAQIDPVVMDQVSQGIQTAFKSNPLLREVESELAKKIGTKPAGGRLFSELIDLDDVQVFASLGKEEPILAVAEVLQEDLKDNAENLTFYNAETRELAKRTFPLVVDDSEEALDEAGIPPGTTYRLPGGTIKKREPAKQERPEKRSFMNTTRFGAF